MVERKEPYPSPTGPPFEDSQWEGAIARVEMLESLARIGAVENIIAELAIRDASETADTGELCRALDLVAGTMAMHAKQLFGLEKQAGMQDELPEASCQTANGQHQGPAAEIFVTPAYSFSSWGALKGSSTLIVVGTAQAGQRTTLAPDGRGGLSPETLTTDFRVQRELLHGMEAGKTIRVCQWGGTRPDGVEVRVDGYPRLEPGSRYLLCLLPETPCGHFTTGVFQGAFTVSKDDLVNNISDMGAARGLVVHDIQLDAVIESIRAATAVPNPGPR